MPADTTVGFDTHAHLIPGPIVDAARDGRFDMEVSENHLVTKAARVPLATISAVDQLTGWVESNDLDGAIVSAPPPLFDVEPDKPREWSERLNDALLTSCADFSALRPLALLPGHDPKVAARMLDHLDRGFAGVLMGTDLRDRMPSGDEFEEIWAQLEGRQLPLFVHPGETHDQRLNTYYLANLVGNPMETTVFAAHLVFGGVLTAHPNLKVILAHGGGAVAQLVGRWDRGHATQRPGLADLEEKPSESVRRLHVDSVVHGEENLRLLRSTFGDDRILFGSDWPFPMGADSISSSLSGWEGGQGVLGENAQRLFGG